MPLKRVCKFCVKGDTEPLCGAAKTSKKSRRRAKFCTREPGHEGPHISCTNNRHKTKVWYGDDKLTVKTKEKS